MPAHTRLCTAEGCEDGQVEVTCNPARCGDGCGGGCHVGWEDCEACGGAGEVSCDGSDACEVCMAEPELLAPEALVGIEATA